MATKRKKRKKSNIAAMQAGLKRYRARLKRGKAPAKKHRRRKRRARAVARRTSFRRKASGRIRPVVIVSGGSFRRPAKSKYFPRPTRINPLRNPRRRRFRRNPIGKMLPFRQAFNKRTLVRYAAVGGGIGLGALLSRFLNTGAIPFMAPPAVAPAWVATLQKARVAHGLIHILVGVTIQAKMRNPMAKDFGVGLAALGGFDLLMQILSKLGVQGLPTFSGMNVSFMGMNVDTPRVLRVAGEGGTEDADDFVDSLDT